MPATNWSGNLTYGTPPQNVQSIQELQNHTRKAQNVKVIGSRHSFNDISDTSSTLLSLESMNRVLEIDTDNQTVTAEGGIRYGELAVALNQAGYGLHNLASLPHISVVGACATGTHGSGIANGNLATAVSGLSLITGSGEHIHLTREDNPDVFNGTVVNIGALGIVTSITLDIVPTYQISAKCLCQLTN